MSDCLCNFFFILFYIQNLAGVSLLDPKKLAMYVMFRKRFHSFNQQSSARSGTAMEPFELVGLGLGFSGYGLVFGWLAG